ncbi:MAG TPA: HAD family hydrolase [Candidatus Brocadiaceae bacterium]|nr:HAD family hydrolase [Candidatus Brocadiaceae bacterium]
MRDKKAVFLDRDGTIVVHEPYLSSPDRLKLLPYAAEGIRLFQKMGYFVFIITNQSGIARGFFDEERLLLIHDKLLTMLQKEGITVTGIYYCPHHTEGVVAQYTVACDCRKPKPKMILDAANKYHVDLSRSLMIGDAAVDMQAGKNAGCICVLVKNPHSDASDELSKSADYVVNDLREAAVIFG